MAQKVALDPALGLTPAELAAAWNANPTLVADHGPARVEAAPPGQFNDPFVEMGFLIVSSLALNTFSTLFLDILKELIVGKPQPTISIRQVDQPDGSKLVIVVVEK